MERRHSDADAHQDEQSAIRSAGVPLAAVLGLLGMLAALVPGLFWLAWLCGGIAIAAALPTVREDDRAAPGYTVALVALGIGVVAVVLGVLNLAIALGWFDYFTVDNALR